MIIIIIIYSACARNDLDEIFSDKTQDGHLAEYTTRVGEDYLNEQTMERMSNSI
jgi:hypothetical protein